MTDQDNISLDALIAYLTVVARAIRTLDDPAAFIETLEESLEVEMRLTNASADGVRLLSEIQRALIQLAHTVPPYEDL